MKIAFILPSLKNQGPIIVAKDIIVGLINKVDNIDVYYFDKEEKEIDFACNTYHISFFEKIDFNKYDVVHTHMLRPDMYIWYHRKKHHKCKFISTLHQIIYDNLKGNYNKLTAFIFEKIWVKILNKQDSIVYLTYIMANLYKNRIQIPFQVIYNGRSYDKRMIDAFVDEENQILEIKRQFKVIGTHCLLTKRKGVHQSILALKYLPDYFFIVVGDGMELESLKNLAKQENVYNRCLFLGYKKNAISYLKYFDVYLATSYSEGFSLSLIETGQCSLPTVCSNIEIFKEQYNETEVVFYEIDNIPSLADAIKKAYNHREQYATNIYKRAIEDYSIEKMSTQYLELYSKR
ncbi:glycosyltransferase family 4 protein [Fusobacterium nucleatum]